MEREEADLIEEIKNKTILHWNYRGFKSLPEAIKHWGYHLQELYLKENQLTCLPSWMSDLRNITNLYLSGNKLEKFPTVLRTMEKLVVLDLSDNSIEMLPACIGELKNLKQLYLDDNCLNQLPIEFSKLQNLETLMMSRNEFMALPEWIGSLNKLERLFIDNNCLEELPNRLTLAPALTTISICTNRLKYLPLNSFISPVNIHFNCNPSLNYLSYSILSQLLELGWQDGKCCTPTNVNNSVKTTNINIQLSVNLSTTTDEKTIIELPRQLLKIFQIPNKIPVSLWELSLRALYKNKYEDTLEKDYRPQHDVFYNLLLNGPISVCLNNQCQEPIFTEAWIIVGNSEECEYLVIAVFCSHRCAGIFDAQSRGIDCLQWDFYNG